MSITPWNSHFNSSITRLPQRGSADANPTPPPSESGSPRSDSAHLSTQTGGGKLSPEFANMVTNLLETYGSGRVGASAGKSLPGQSERGEAASRDAREYVGRETPSLKGEMPGFNALGGERNNGTEFVSTALQNQGLLDGNFGFTGALEDALQEQGYQQVPGQEAGPGDVRFEPNKEGGYYTSSLVSSPGAQTTIGATRDGNGREVISEKLNNPDTGVYYSRVEE